MLHLRIKGKSGEFRAALI